MNVLGEASGLNGSHGGAEHRRPVCIYFRMTQMAQTSSVAASSLEERIEERLSGILQWLDENAPETRQDQKHLDADTTERAYWHYGYAAALQDIRNCLPGKNDRVS